MSGAVSCRRHDFDHPTCAECERRRFTAERRRLPIPVHIPHRTLDQRRHAAEVVRHLRGLTLYEQARWCEQVLARHLPGIEVRPERRRVRRVA